MVNSDEIRWQQRFSNFSKAFAQLDSACEQEHYSDLERAGLVQMFEFTMELAWNTLKDLLFYEGYDAKTPRDAIRKAFEAEYLTEDETETLLDALTKRNVLSHTYDEKTAAEAEYLVKHVYTPVFRSLYNRLQRKRQA